jgi:hypothetical protein
MKSRHQHTFQPQIPPSIPHSRISPCFIQPLQPPLPLSLHPEPHPAWVQAHQPIKTHCVVVLIHPPSSHSPPLSLREFPPHQWLIQPLLGKPPHWTIHPLLLHHQRCLQASQLRMLSQLTLTLHDWFTQLLAVLLFQHSHPSRQLETSFGDTSSFLTS